MEPEAASATQPDNRDHVLPEGKWQFDAEVTDVFDEMLRRSIPQYDVMRKAVFEIASRFAVRKTAIIDLGCSRGDALAPLVSRFGVNNRFVGVEVSQPMLTAARQRFRGMIDCGVVSIRDMDLRHHFPPERASVILSVLTLQFTPIEYRLKIVREAFNSLVPGGALILVEKVLGASADVDVRATAFGWLGRPSVAHQGGAFTCGEIHAMQTLTHLVGKVLGVLSAYRSR